MKPSPRGLFFIILLLIILTGVSVTILLGIAMGIGSTLARLSSFSLFEATLLSLISIGIVSLLFYRLVQSFIGFLISSSDEEEGEDEYSLDTETSKEQGFTYKEIPVSRFDETGGERTWQTWLRYQLANDIYMEFQETPEHVPNMNDRQLQELTIRLADITIAILRAKTIQAKRLRIPMSRFKQQMVRMDQKPYDDDILVVALGAINLDIDHYYDEILGVIQNKQWDEPTDMFEASS